MDLHTFLWNAASALYLELGYWTNNLCRRFFIKNLFYSPIGWYRNIPLLMKSLNFAQRAIPLSNDSITTNDLSTWIQLKKSSCPRGRPKAGWGISQKKILWCRYAIVYVYFCIFFGLNSQLIPGSFFCNGY